MIIIILEAAACFSIRLFHWARLSLLKITIIVIIYPRLARLCLALCLLTDGGLDVGVARATRLGGARAHRAGKKLRNPRGQST